MSRIKIRPYHPCYHPWSDVDFFSKRIRLYWRKNRAGEWKYAWIPVREELMDMLKDHRKVTEGSKFVFVNMQRSSNPEYWIPFQHRQRWLQELCEKAKVESFGYHGIRHLFASILADKNIPLPEIQYMLRHESLATTQKYIHRLKKNNREVLEALPGLEAQLGKRPLKGH